MVIQDAAGNKTTVALQVFQFPNASGLQQASDTQWVVTGFSGQARPVPQESVQITGGVSDMAAVQKANELASVITAQREYVSSPAV
jgi:flagellar basal body rod protein FlgG